MTKVHTIVVSGTLTVLLALGCGAKDRAEKQGQQYDVVEEGSASGVSATLVAPGETASTPPLTGTNADTTTNFTLPLDPARPQPGTISGTQPQTEPGVWTPPGVPPEPEPRALPRPMISSTPGERPRATTPQPRPAPPAAPPPATTTTQPEQTTPAQTAPPAEQPPTAPPSEPRPKAPPQPSPAQPAPTQTTTTPPPADTTTQETPSPAPAPPPGGAR